MNDGKEGGTRKADIAKWLFHPITVRNIKLIGTRFPTPTSFYYKVIPRLIRIGEAMIVAESEGLLTNESLKELVGTNAADAQGKFDLRFISGKEELSCALLFWWLRDLDNLNAFDHLKGVQVMEEFKGMLQQNCEAAKAADCAKAVDGIAWGELEEWPPGLRWSKREEHHENPLEYFNRLFEAIQLFTTHSTASKMIEFLERAQQPYTEESPAWWHPAHKSEANGSYRYLLDALTPPNADCFPLVCQWKLSVFQARSQEWQKHMADILRGNKELDKFSVEGPITSPGLWTVFAGDLIRWRNKFRIDQRLTSYQLGSEDRA